MQWPDRDAQLKVNPEVPQQYCTVLYRNTEISPWLKPPKSDPNRCIVAEKIRTRIACGGAEFGACHSLTNTPFVATCDSQV